MAGSFNHTVTKDGQLLSNVDLVGMLENGGDVYEYAEEAYGMVWWLATELARARADSRSGQGLTAAEYIERARQNYKVGLERSPGIAEEGELEDADPEDET